MRTQILQLYLKEAYDFLDGLVDIDSTPARIVATVKDSVLRTEMAGLESLEEDAPKSILFYTPMGWLGQIRSHRRDEAWSASMCQTFFTTVMGPQIPDISEKPLAVCACRKFQIDPLGDHISTCNSHSGAKKAHDWAVDQITDLFRTTTKVKTQQVTPPNHPRAIRTIF